MTPERIAELRESALSQGGWHHSSRLLEALNEIERLGGLVRNAHVFDAYVRWPSSVVARIYVKCGACEWCASVECKDSQGSPHTDEARAAHRAHVDALIAGTA
jgi:hypothetical protein